MSGSRSVRLSSLIALALLFCPANIIAAVPFIVFAAIYCIHKMKDEKYTASKVDTKHILFAFFPCLMLGIAFQFRWESILPTAAGLGVGLIAALFASISIPALIASYKAERVTFENNPSKLSHYDYIIAVVFGIIIPFLVSSGSPMIPINGTNDAHIFFTVGRGITHGKMIYRDLIEQKGPILYYINAAGALISPYDFKGVYIMEVISCGIFILFGIKTTRLLTGSSHTLISSIAVGILTFISFSSHSFAYGNTAEEFCLPFMAAGIYLCIKAVSSGKITFKETIPTGIMIALIFWIKFTLCGMFIGIAIYLCFYFIKRHDIKGLLKTIAGVLIGFIAVSVPIVIFFAVNNALSEMIDFYFVLNIFRYNMGSSEDASLITRILDPFLMLLLFSGLNFQLPLFFGIGQIFMYKRNKKTASMLTLAFITCFFFAFIGTKSYPYYAFVLTPLTVIGWAPAATGLNLLLKDRKASLRNILAVGIAVITCGLSLGNARNAENYGIKKEDYPGYYLSRIIMQDDDRSLICYAFLDRGFYTYTHQDPDMRYFTYMNADSEHILEVQRDLIRSRKYKYIITEYNPIEVEGYSLIATDKSPTEDIDYYLYRRDDNA